MSKIKSRIYINVLLTICVSLVAVGCSTEKSNPDFVDPTAHPELVDQSWLTGEPCAAPCWQGLEPGKSTRDDALKTVPRLSFLRSKNYINPGDPLISFFCEKPPEKMCMKMRYVNKILSELALYPNYSITLDDVVAQLGEPDSFIIFRPGAERRDCLYRVFWLHQRLELMNNYIGKGYLPFQHDLCDRIQESGGKVPKNVEIQMVIIYSPEEFDRLTKILSEGNLFETWTGFSE